MSNKDMNQKIELSIVTEKIILKYIESDPEYTEDMKYVGRYTRAVISEAIDFPSMEIALSHTPHVYMKVVPVKVRVTYEEVE